METLSTVVGRVMTAMPAHSTKPSKMEPTACQPRVDCWPNGWLTHGDPALERVRDEVSNFYRALCRAKPPFWLTLCGVPGCGKTWAAKLVWRRFLSVGRLYRDTATNALLARSGRWVNWVKLLSDTKAGDYSWRDGIRSEHFVVLDDIGAEAQTEFAKEQLFVLLSARVGRWTLITSNLTPEQIGKRVDQRIASRLIRDRNRVVHNTARDYALRRVGQ
jgi:DNA replication protein DnaC